MPTVCCDVEKNRRSAALRATYPQQLSKTLPSEHIPIPTLSKKLTCKHIHSPSLSKRFTCKHIHNPKPAGSLAGTRFALRKCKLKVLNAVLNYLNY